MTGIRKAVVTERGSLMRERRGREYGLRDIDGRTPTPLRIDDV